MSNATYTFLPWLRQGIANQISAASGARATVPIRLKLTYEPVDGVEFSNLLPSRDIQLYGPGDVTGLDANAIIKVEPRNWITNFEPNYLPYIEFYDEDLPWRYSPLPNPGDHRLMPWLALVVLAEDEFKDNPNARDAPLPFLTFPAGNPGPVLPPPGQLWAWAHVHVNGDLVPDALPAVVSADSNAVGTRLTTALGGDPDLAYSRIVCPRRLKPQTSYAAFLVPTFEAGRLAGLGEDPSAATPAQPAWSEAGAPDRLPYYHRWHFRTGTVGDFEYLVRLLKPQPVDRRVGVRDLDVQRPGANLKGITDAALGGFLRLGGALRIPHRNYTPDELAEVKRYEDWATPYPHPFQTSLAAFLNLPDDYRRKSALAAHADAKVVEETPAAAGTPAYSIENNPDPIITAPLYGQWHALTQRLLEDPAGNPDPNRTNWVHELNLDPRWRVAAGFGTKIVQENQETYMQSAWEQVGDVLEANRKIRAAQLARAAAQVWYLTHLKTIKESNVGKWLALATPVSKRILSDGATVHFAVQQSKVPLAALSVGMRKLLRPRGKLTKRLVGRTGALPGDLVGSLNAGKVTAAPPKVTPAGVVTLAGIADTLRPENLRDLSEKLREMMQQLPAYQFLWNQAGGDLHKYLDGVKEEQQRNAEIIAGELFGPGLTDNLLRSNAYRPWLPGDARHRFEPGEADNEEANRFKKALQEVNEAMRAETDRGRVPVKPPLDLDRAGQALFEGLNPSVTIPRWTWGSVHLPGRIRSNLPEAFVEAMAYPEFDLPMYRPLVNHSTDLFLPNINYLAENSISLLETNQKFIEAYMVGLNHEFARELLWREYPTDQRGSYFRQFWETQGFLNTEGLSAEQLKEKLRDIPPLHKWGKGDALGEHDHREEGGAREEEVVLAIRGELLKKYPNAVIYAHKAVWTKTADDQIDLTQERQLQPLTAAEEAGLPRSIIKTPLYEAQVDPDIHFFGFDLTACAAKGGPGRQGQPVNPACATANIPWDDPGWFFVIKERPGEPRFGFDIGGPPPLPEVKVWNDLSWNDLKPAVPESGFIRVPTNAADAIPLQPLDLPDENEKQEQRNEDNGLAWNAQMSSAELAYILYQVPVLVAVHASEMLPDK
jgi:hypothetical protein